MDNLALSNLPFHINKKWSKIFGWKNFEDRFFWSSRLGAVFSWKRATGYDIRLFKETLNGGNVQDVKDFEVLPVFIYSNIDRKIIDKLLETRLLATRSTRFDHIDLQACKSKGILVCNVPLYGEITVAEQ